jgi:hypothetical protein
MVADPLRDEIRRLVLPVAPQHEGAAVAAVRHRLGQLGLTEADQPERVRQLTDQWRSEGGALSGDLRVLVQRAIRSGFPAADPTFAATYHKTHARLQDQHVMAFEEATALLSQAPLMRDLVVSHHMSASAVARALAARRGGADISWRAVAAVLRSMRAAPKLVIGEAHQPDRPRGGNAGFLLDTYAPLVNTLSAFLNNMKAVERLDTAWARARDREPARARALVECLAVLEAMAFLPRVELAAWVRQWLLRVVGLATPALTPVPDVATEPMVRRVLARLTEMPGGTETGGVVEQRVVDALATTIHPDADGWRPRGLGAPVNATNISARRLGDCDFQRPPGAGTPPEVVAYEATAGRLSRTYLDGHLQTLKRALASRRDELEAVADLASWRVRVVFVAHEFAPDLTPGPLPPADYFGVTVEVEHLQYEGLIERADDDRLADAFTTHVHAPLNERRTPRQAREKYLAMLAE